MFEAADAIYQWAIKQTYVDPDNIVIMGYSI
jgi:dienelactone hydrolase